MMTLIILFVVLIISIRENIEEIYYHIPFVKKTVMLKKKIVEKKYRRRHTKALNIIYIINISVYLVILSIQLTSGELLTTINQLIAVPLYLPSLNYIWTMITYSFVHYSFTHFASNILALYFISPIIRKNFKNKEIVQIYIIGAIGSALFSSFLFGIIYKNHLLQNPDQIPMLIGASGSIYAFFGAIYHKLPSYDYKFFFFSSKMKYVFWFMIITSILSIFFNYNVGGNFAHLGGAITGYLIVSHYNKLKTFKINK